MSLTKRRDVVIVEDDDTIRSMMCELLAAAGFTTIGCKNGYDALRCIRDRRPAAVTLDIHMPGMDGVEVLDQLAADGATADLPVVVVSAFTSDRRLRTRRQVAAIIQKPFDVDDLCRKVRWAAGDTVTTH